MVLLDMINHLSIFSDHLSKIIFGKLGVLLVIEVSEQFFQAELS